MAALSTDEGVLRLIAVGVLCPAGGPKNPPPVPKFTDYSITTGRDCSGTMFTNRGASGPLTFLLPPPSQRRAGQFYEFVAIQNLAITVATLPDCAVASGSAVATSLTLKTGQGSCIGGKIRAVCDGVSWILCGETVGMKYGVDEAVPLPVRDALMADLDTAE